MAGNITIKDIAREAGVSIALVSFVMNNRVEADGKQKYRVSDQTRNRVLEVAARLDYRPNSAARTLRQGHSRTIGVVLSDMANIFYGIIARELEDEIFRRGYTPLFGSTDENPEKFDRLIRSFIEKGVEGFVIVPCEGSAPSVRHLMETGHPFVVIDRYHPDFQVPSVLTDNEDAMQKAIAAIREQGATRLEMVSYGMRISSMTDRERCFRECLGADAFIYTVPFEHVAQEAERVADEVIRKGTDGLVIASNVLSVAVIKALHRRGVRIPQEVRIVGFDYSNIYGVFSPAIPYILQPLPEIARSAAALLFDLVDRKENGKTSRDNPETIILKTTLMQ